MGCFFKKKLDKQLNLRLMESVNPSLNRLELHSGVLAKNKHEQRPHTPDKQHCFKKGAVCMALTFPGFSLCLFLICHSECQAM